MAKGEDTRNHPNRRVSKDMIGRGMVEGMQTLGHGGVNDDLSLRVANGIGKGLEAAGAKYIGDPVHPAKAASIKESGTIGKKNK